MNLDTDCHIWRQLLLLFFLLTYLPIIKKTNKKKTNKKNISIVEYIFPLLAGVECDLGFTFIWARPFESGQWANKRQSKTVSLSLNNSAGPLNVVTCMKRQTPRVDLRFASSQQMMAYTEIVISVNSHNSWHEQLLTTFGIFSYLCVVSLLAVDSFFVHQQEYF